MKEPVWPRFWPSLLISVIGLVLAVAAVRWWG